MNSILHGILNLFRGQNAWKILSQVFIIGAGFIAQTGKSPNGFAARLAMIMTDASLGLEAYMVNDRAKASRIVNGIITALQAIEADLQNNQPTPVPIPAPVSTPAQPQAS